MVAIWKRRARKGEPALGTGPDEEVFDAAPDRLRELRARFWLRALRRTVREFKVDELPDRAAALTYYGVLAIFPALLVLVSLLGVVGKSATDSILTNLEELAPSSAHDILRDAVNGLRDSAGTGGVLAVVGLIGALWSASGYIAAFIRAANIVYDIPEGRPAWKTVPLRLAVTVMVMALLAASAVIVVFSGSLAERAGQALGLGSAALTVWAYAKWPVLLLLVIMIIGLLYWSAPNVRVRGWWWLTPGSTLAVLVWLAASTGFALYVANFGSYNKTYGALAGVIIFLVWLWLSNLAILLGLEFDAEIARQRALAGGLPAETEPYVQPRDTRTWPRRPRRPRQPHPRHGLRGLRGLRGRRGSAGTRVTPAPVQAPVQAPAPSHPETRTG